MVTIDGCFTPENRSGHTAKSRCAYITSIWPVCSCWRALFTAVQHIPGQQRSTNGMTTIDGIYVSVYNIHRPTAWRRRQSGTRVLPPPSPRLLTHLISIYKHGVTAPLWCPDGSLICIWFSIECTSTKAQCSVTVHCVLSWSSRCIYFTNVILYTTICSMTNRQIQLRELDLPTKSTRDVQMYTVQTIGSC